MPHWIEYTEASGNNVTPLDDDDGTLLCDCRECQYVIGLTPPNYPVPATLKASVSDLGERWSNWMD